MGPLLHDINGSEVIAHSLTGSRLKSNALIALIGRVVTLAASFTLSIIATRTLTLDEAGAFFYLLSLCLFVGIAGRFGMEIVALRYISLVAMFQPERAWRTFNLTFTWVNLQLCLILPIMGLLLAFSNFEYSLLDIGGSLLLGLTLTHVLYFSEAVRGFNDIPLSITFGGLAYYIGALLAWLLAFWIVADSLTLTTIIWLLAGLGVSHSLLAFSVIRNRYGAKGNDHTLRQDEGKLSDFPRSIADIYRSSLPIGGASVLGFLLVNGDLWLLAMLGTAMDVAIYGAALRLTFFIVFPLQIANIIVSPFIANLYAQGEKRTLLVLLRGSSFLVSVVSLPIALIFFLYGDLILGILYGPTYGPGSVFLKILLFSWLLKAVTGPCGYVLFMSGEQQVVFLASLACSILCLPLAFILFSWLGPIGLAICFTTASITLQSSLLYFCRTRLGLNPTASFSQFRHLLKLERIVST